MMKEHKKMYKKGKLWVTASLFVAAGSLAVAMTTAHADQVTTDANNQTTQTVQTVQNRAALQQTAYQTDSANQTNTQNRQASVNVGNLDSVSAQPSKLAGYSSLNVSGWHATDVSKAQPNHYVIVYDNTQHKELGRHKVATVSRPDVQRAYPNVENSMNSGFNSSFYLPNSVFNNGDSLSVVARTTDDAINGEGNHTDLWFRPFKIDNANHAYLDGVSIDNNQVKVSGWHATNQGYPHRNHFIIAFDASQHREITRVRVGYGSGSSYLRNDVSRVFPTVLDAAYSGFNASFSLQPAFLHDQVQFISRWTSSADGNSDYVDYWFKPQWLVSDRSNRAWLDSFNIRNGKLHVAGWHATNEALAKPYHTIIIVNGKTGRELGRQTVTALPRNDVAKAYPGIMTANKSGFSTDFNLSGAMINIPLRVISRWSASADANENYTDYAFNERLDMNKQAGWLDNFSENDDNSTVSVSGWHAADMSEWYRHHFIILYDLSQHRELGRHEVNNTYSNDVAHAKPGILNANQARFNTSFTIDPYYGDDMMQVVSRYSDSPNGEGNYTQIWMNNRLLNTPKMALVGQVLYDRNGNAHNVPTDTPEHVARVIVDCINASQPKSEIDRLSLAAEFVHLFCQRCTYTESGPYYYKPIGVFIKHQYSCAGATRAVGMVLNMMGYSYRHVNENKWAHQWAIVNLHGQNAWVDADLGQAGWGDYLFPF